MITTSPKRRWYQFSLRTLLFVVTVGLVTYVSSFYALRRQMSVTFLVGNAPMDPKGFYSVHVFLFSKSRPLNYVAWLLYYPLHRQRTDSLNLLEEAFFVEGGDDEMAGRKLRVFYVAEVNILYRAEVVGFHPASPNSSAPAPNPPSRDP